MKLVKGSNLTEEQKQEVLSAFIYRYTVDNKRNYEGDHTCGATMTDSEWLEEYAFYITKKGKLALNRNYCKPAWMIK
jgi:hypothetical protein